MQDKRERRRNKDAKPSLPDLLDSHQKHIKLANQSALNATKWSHQVKLNQPSRETRRILPLFFINLAIISSRSHPKTIIGYHITSRCSCQKYQQY